ncbi:SDR family oxidoreductase [Reinekea marinisedimentorum]|uniref:NADP-dependent 3-hydroxy acid dehydrogenase YdfG n=1 Tax=Reinekea marinisedimentorum TaxID=230495 RepID=A0A4R3I763_9GAMM|nr:SDR family oxidoreductase [Reinekea marinisedimentorum]TCS41986.1 NADP-dependent 3-hydroxy acid dehydrogenase YdfG [Reinekea marinisedimentorum]
MQVFITGGTGFIGRRLVARLLESRPEIHTLYILVRPASLQKADKVLQKTVTNEHLRDKVKFIQGDLSEPALGVSEEAKAQMAGSVDHFFHLGAIYDLKADRDSQYAVNVQGSQYAVEFAREIGVKTFHLMSSIAAAGFYPGVFREDMFTEATGLDHPYFSTKHESERIVRDQTDFAYRIYRPSFVVGDSKTGEMDKVDGPYYLFNMLKSIRQALPPWFPLLGLEGGYFNLVPVDFVVNAISQLAFEPDQDGQAFHLTDKKHWRFGQLLNLFARSAHSPEFDVRINARLVELVPIMLRKNLTAIPGVKEIVDDLLESMGIPKDLFRFINWPTQYDNRKAEQLLEKAGIFVPDLETYAPALWDYWERNLDAALFTEKTLEDRLNHKVVLITGGSSGIGKATAKRLSQVGAVVIICARDPEKLQAAHAEIEKAGGRVYSYVADITQQQDVDNLFSSIKAQLGGVDYLINNAGHSIRRPVTESLERLHDFERTIQLNYLAAVSMVLKSIPLMEERGGGHVINISSIGVLSNAPRFSAYVGSKAALEAFSRCAAAELADHKVHFTNINMPLVRTPMIAPTALYNNVPALTPEEAAELVVEAVLKRSERVSTRLGKFAEVVHALSPKTQRQIMNTAFRLFKEADKGKKQDGSGEKAKAPQPSPAQLMFASLMKGVHW